MNNTLSLTIPLKENTLKRLAKKPLGEAQTDRRIRKAFEKVYAKTPEEVIAGLIDNTVWEATVDLPRGE